MERHIFLVLTNPVPGREQEYNDWYTNRHLQDVTELDGFVRAHRFRVHDPHMAIGEKYQYVAIYEVAAGQLGAAKNALSAAAATPGRLFVSDALDADREAMWLTSVGEWPPSLGGK